MSNAHKHQAGQRRRTCVLGVEPLERRTLLSGFGGAGGFEGDRDFHRLDQHDGFRGFDRNPTEYRSDDRFGPRPDPHFAFQPEPPSLPAYRPAPPPSLPPVTVSLRPEPPTPFISPRAPLTVPNTATIESSRPAPVASVFQRPAADSPFIASAASLAGGRLTALSGPQPLLTTLLDVSVADAGSILSDNRDETLGSGSTAASKSEARPLPGSQEKALDETLVDPTWTRKRRLPGGQEPGEGEGSEELIERDAHSHDQQVHPAIDFVTVEIAAFPKGEHARGVWLLQFLPELSDGHGGEPSTAAPITDELVELLALGAASLTEFLPPASSEMQTDRQDNAESQVVLSANMDHFQSLEILPPPETNPSVFLTNRDTGERAIDSAQPSLE